MAEMTAERREGMNRIVLEELERENRAELKRMMRGGVAKGRLIEQREAAWAAVRLTRCPRSDDLRCAVCPEVGRGEPRAVRDVRISYVNRRALTCEVCAHAAGRSPLEGEVEPARSCLPVQGGGGRLR